ncbi:hypothetical protein BJ742DRAFT_873380 [Cladochytrium replicatum]|nr:hypothetical protein BJ742DRAFT_873380 [Cladochytrium replicatum]
MSFVFALFNLTTNMCVILSQVAIPSPSFLPFFVKITCDLVNFLFSELAICIESHVLPFVTPLRVVLGPAISSSFVTTSSYSIRDFFIVVGSTSWVSLGLFSFRIAGLSAILSDESISLRGEQVEDDNVPFAQERKRIDNSGRIVDPKTFKYDQIRLYKQQYERDILKKREEIELDRQIELIGFLSKDLEVAILHQLAEDKNRRSQKLRTMNLHKQFENYKVYEYEVQEGDHFTAASGGTSDQLIHDDMSGDEYEDEDSTVRGPPIQFEKREDSSAMVDTRLPAVQTEGWMEQRGPSLESDVNELFESSRRAFEAADVIGVRKAICVCTEVEAYVRGSETRSSRPSSVLSNERKANVTLEHSGQESMNVMNIQHDMEKSISRPVRLKVDLTETDKPSGRPVKDEKPQMKRNPAVPQSTRESKEPSIVEQRWQSRPMSLSLESAGVEAASIASLSSEQSLNRSVEEPGAEDGVTAKENSRRSSVKMESTNVEIAQPENFSRQHSSASMPIETVELQTTEFAKTASRSSTMRSEIIGEEASRPASVKAESNNKDELKIFSRQHSSSSKQDGNTAAQLISVSKPRSRPLSLREEGIGAQEVQVETLSVQQSTESGPESETTAPASDVAKPDSRPLSLKGSVKRSVHGQEALSRQQSKGSNSGEDSVLAREVPKPTSRPLSLRGQDAVEANRSHYSCPI